jgi:hypothetical protein
LACWRAGQETRRFRERAAGHAKNQHYSHGETMNEKTFQALVRYGSILVGICLILNVWVVMRHVEVYREASKADVRVQQLMAQQQVFQTVLQEFAARASTDADIAGIFKKAQALNGPTGSVSAISNQPLPPTAPTGAER